MSEHVCDVPVGSNRCSTCGRHEIQPCTCGAQIGLRFAAAILTLERRILALEARP